MQAVATNDASSAGIVWSLGGPGSLSSLTGPAVTYVAPAGSFTAPEQATVTARSVADPTKSASLAITVNPNPVIFSQSLANGTVGTPYSQPVVLTGGTAPFQWRVYNGSIESGFDVGGSVPDGLTLNAATGQVSGTPTAAGTWYFEPIATDADQLFGFSALSIQINPASATKANPVPFLNQPLVPAAVSPGGAAITIQASGMGFVSGATIDINGTPLATTFVDGGHLSALLPATDTATAKTATITVANPSPGGGLSNPVFFQVGASETAVSFANAPSSPLQVTEPFGLAVADFNEDGKPDLAISAGIKLSVMLSNGDGTFTSASGSPVSIPSPPYDDFGSPYIGPLIAGDFTHSGHQSLAVAEFQNEAAVILLGGGDGTFAPSSAAFANAPGMPLAALQAADFNADGNLDLVLIDSLSGSSLISLGYGKGSFNAAYDFYAPGAGVAAGDFNGDGKLDLAIAEGGGTAIWLGNGDGTFTQATGLSYPGHDLSAIVAGDFNGDGKLDLAAPDATGNAVLVLLGNGDGTFQPPISVPVGNQPFAMVVGDFNNDGKLDLATANYGDGTVSLILGNSDGTFTQSSGSPYKVGKSPASIAAADFNGDGKLDLAVANQDDTVSILLQQ